MTCDSPASHGLSGKLRIGFTENSCERGVAPESFRRFRELQPDAETPALAVSEHVTDRGNWSGRQDAGFVRQLHAEIRSGIGPALAWRKDNTSLLLANFIGDERRLPDVRTVNK